MTVEESYKEVTHGNECQICGFNERRALTKRFSFWIVLDIVLLIGGVVGAYTWAVYMIQSVVR